MKKVLLILLAAALGSVSPALAGNVGFDLNVHVSSPLPAPIIVDAPPLFLVPPALGFQVAVDIPYDMFRLDGRYYLSKGNAWFVAPGYDGPWTGIRRDRLPRRLAGRRVADIIALRDEEYRHYKRDRDHYRGRAYRPERSRKEEHGKEDHKKHHH
jgi:hypothetical protein